MHRAADEVVALDPDVLFEGGVAAQIAAVLVLEEDRVGNRVEQPAGETQLVGQSLALQRQFFFGPLALGHIARRIEQQALSVDHHRHATDVDGDQAAVPVAIAGVQHTPLRTVELLPQSAGPLVVGETCIPARHVAADQFLSRVAEHCAEGVADLDEVAGGIEDMDAIAGGAQQGPVFLGFMPQLGLRPAQFRHFGHQVQGVGGRRRIDRQDDVGEHPRTAGHLRTGVRACRLARQAGAQRQGGAGHVTVALEDMRDQPAGQESQGLLGSPLPIRVPAQP
ncbi:MAG: hypothetical protein AW07_01154 [Candidatus Accumulibacter sp. SK-11]|nr:MAG: hypothetical protein AW07_01154 [Candidatus Accumulibacter sp. SK-11]